MFQEWREFENEQDPFNPENYLSGKINRENGDRYGRLVLTKINDEECYQVIYSVPKMYYPQSHEGIPYKLNLTENATCYDKLDGTAIVSYMYHYKNKKYVTYKTRLNPVLKAGKYGNFYAMWKEMLEKYPTIPQVTKEGFNLCFELYGILNKHLIVYPFRLDTVLLFGLDRNTNKIILPDKWEDNFPTPKKHVIIKPEDDFPLVYTKLRNDLEDLNKIISETEVEGTEGSVIYIKQDGEYKQWKCKPYSVFRVHTKAGIRKNDVVITVYNALENVELENITYEFVYELLKEEFIENDIKANELRIKSIIKEVIEEVKLRYEIIRVYQGLGKNVLEYKKEVMNRLSEYFPSNKMRYVYSIITAFENKK